MADLSMYAAKEQRAGVLVYDEARDGVNRHRLELIARLREGIAERQLVLHYQPQVDLRTGRATGVEALVRWRHPEQGLLGPHAFLGLAESAGLMGALTTLVLEEALAQARRWRSAGLALRVAVNVSPSALVDDDFPAQVERALAAHGLPGSVLVVEVTEELLMGNRERVVGALTRLREWAADCRSSGSRSWRTRSAHTTSWSAPCARATRSPCSARPPPGTRARATARAWSAIRAECSPSSASRSTRRSR
jgi:predicted signal transduction protein with EAL and GGDEF domain